MEEKTKKAWYKHSWGLVLAILFFPFFAIWFVWAKTTLASSTKWMLTGVIVLFILLSTTLNSNDTSSSTNKGEADTAAKSQESAKPSSQAASQPPKSTEPGQDTLDSSVRFSETAFLITNNEKREWKGCKFEMNSGLFSGGYIYRQEVVAANDSLIIPFREFTKGDGTRFNADTTKPQNISIYCTDVAGKTGFNYFGLN